MKKFLFLPFILFFISLNITCTSCVSTKTVTSYTPTPASVAPSVYEKYSFLLSDPTTFCAQIETVEKDPNFPAPEWLILKKARDCNVATEKQIEKPAETPADKQAGEKNIEQKNKILQLFYSEKKPWLKKIEIETALIIAEKDIEKNLPENNVTLARLYYERAQTNNKTADRQKDFEQARKYAQKDQNKSEAKEWLEKIEQSLFKLAPRLIINPERAQWLAVAQDYRRAMQFVEAEKWFQKIIAKSLNNNEKLDALKGLRITYKLSNQKDRYLQTNRDLSKWVEAQYKLAPHSQEALRQFMDAKSTLVRSLWTEDHTAEAEEQIDHVITLLKAKVSLAEFRWIQARMAEEKKDLLKSLQFLDLAIADLNTNSELWEKYSWQKAWLLRKMNGFEESSSVLENLLASKLVTITRSKYTYWLAKNLIQLKQTDRAQELFRKIISEDPLSYYTALSYRALQIPLPAIHPVALPNLTSAASTLPTEFTRELEWYIFAKEDELSQRMLDLSRMQNIAEKSPDKIDLPTYSRAQYFSGILNWFNLLLPEDKVLYAEKIPNLIFPMPQFETIQALSQKVNVDPLLVLSIIRQESAFNKIARSPADALGLMQLLPSVARPLAKQLNLNLAHPEDLYQIETNLKIGTLLLSQTFKRMSNNMVLTIAAYNAAFSAVKGWARKTESDDMVEFIEDIPYEETKVYVKLVLRNYIYYLRLTTSQNETPFPEHCLNSWQDTKL